MDRPITVGFDLAKDLFQVHGRREREHGCRRQLRRSRLLPFFSRLEPRPAAGD